MEECSVFSDLVTPSITNLTQAGEAPRPPSVYTSISIGMYYIHL